MFKPTKPQHITNKKYADENSGGGVYELVIEPVIDEGSQIGWMISKEKAEYILEKTPIVVWLKNESFFQSQSNGLIVYLSIATENSADYVGPEGGNSMHIEKDSFLTVEISGQGTRFNFDEQSGGYTTVYTPGSGGGR